MNFLSIFQHIGWIAVIIISMYDSSIGKDFWPHFVLILLAVTCISQRISIDICEKS